MTRPMHVLNRLSVRGCISVHVWLQPVGTVIKAIILLQFHFPLDKMTIVRQWIHNNCGRAKLYFWEKCRLHGYYILKIHFEETATSKKSIDVGHYMHCRFFQ